MLILTSPPSGAILVPAMNDETPPDGLSAIGLGDTQRALLELLKRGGEQSVGDLATRVELAAETVRGHLNALAGRGLVRRCGRRKDGPGRPEILYHLTERADGLFPDGEGRLLRELTAYLTEEGREDVLRSFFEARVERQRDRVRERLEGLEGRRRLEEVAGILSEEGFMAEVVAGEEREGPRLRLCHCPLKEMVAASRTPCRAEVAWIEEMLGRDLARRSWMPEGGRTCTYSVGDR